MNGHLDYLRVARTRLYELDLVARFERDDCLLIVRANAWTTLATFLVLASIGHGIDPADRHLERLLNRFGDLMFVGIAKDFERVLTEDGREFVGLLREADEF